MPTLPVFKYKVPHEALVILEVSYVQTPPWMRRNATRLFCHVECGQISFPRKPIFCR